MELEIHRDEREVLLRDLEEFVENLSESYREKGGTWDPYDPRTPSIANIVRARDDLRGEPPWCLDAPRRDLELLITQLRAGASAGLKARGDPPPAGLPSLNALDPEGADSHLDIITVCDSVLGRLLNRSGE